MKFFFKENDTQTIVAKIMEQLGGRQLGEMVSFSATPQGVEIKISKLGTSVFKFTRKDRDGGIELNLTEEKVAFAHRAFEKDVKEKLVKVVEKAGGQNLA